MNKSIIRSLLLFSLCCTTLTIPTINAMKHDETHQASTWREKFKNRFISAKSAAWSATKSFTKDTLSLSGRILRLTAVTAGAIGLSYLAVIGTLLILRQTTGIFIPITPSELANLFRTTIPTAINSAAKNLGANVVKGAFDEVNGQLAKEFVASQAIAPGKQTLLSFIGQQAAQGAASEFQKQLPAITAQLQTATAQTATIVTQQATTAAGEELRKQIPSTIASLLGTAQPYAADLCSRLNTIEWTFLQRRIGIKETLWGLLKCTTTPNAVIKK